MRYAIRKVISSNLFIRGIEWETGNHNGHISYTHHTIQVGWSPKGNAYQVKNHLGQVVYQNPMAAECLREATARILDAYADRFVPAWTDIEDEIPIVWDEAA
jgi:hypothetical protein